MVVRQPLLQRRWQQQLLVGFVGKVGLIINDSPLLDWAIIPPNTRQPCFSDGLLVLLFPIGGVSPLLGLEPVLFREKVHRLTVYTLLRIPRGLSESLQNARQWWPVGITCGPALWDDRRSCRFSCNSDEHYPDQFAIRIRGKPRKLGDISGKREYLKKMVGL